MSQVTVYTDLVLRSGPFAADLQAIEQQILAAARRISAAGINVPVKLDDQATGKIEELLAKMRGQPIDLKVTATDDVTPQLERIRATESAKPIHVPVVLDAPVGGVEAPVAAAAAPIAATAATAGAAPVAAAAGVEEAAAGAGGAGFFAGTLTRRGLGAAYIAYHGLNTLANEIGTMQEGANLGRFTDPNEQLQRNRRILESEHQGLRGAVNWVYGKVGLESTYDEQSAQLDEGERAAKKADERIRKQQQGMQAQNRLKEEVESLDTAASEVGQNETQSRLTKLDAAFKKINDAADNIVQHFDQFGFKTEAEAKVVADRMKSDAGTIRTAGQKDVYNDQSNADLTHQATLDAINEAKREADLRAQGQTEQASLASRHANVDRQLGTFERRAAVAPEGSEEKRRATEEFDAAKPAAAAEHTAIDVAERERVADSVNRYEIEAERAKLSAVRGSYNEELRAFEDMWEKKLAKIQNSQEKASAIQARDAERTAMVTRHAEDIADIKASTHEIELRTAGKDKEADVFRVTEEARKALDEAGDDLEKKGAILAHERAQLEALRHEDRGAIFSSVTSFARDVSVRNMRNTGGADIQAAIDTANAEQAAVDAARRGQPAPPTAPGAPAPPATADVTPTEPDYTQRQPGETLDAYRNRGGRAFRANPLTASAEARRRRGIDLRREREAHEQAVVSAAAAAASFTDESMPGGYMDFAGQYAETRRGDAEVNAEQHAADLTDAIMPGGGWFDALHPAGPTQPEPGDMMHGAFAAGDTEHPGAFGGNADLAKLLADVQVQPDLAQNALSAADIANPTMDAIKAAMRPAGAGGGDMGGMFSAGGDDPQAKRDFKDGSSDLKDAAASLNRTLSDAKNRLYVVR